MPNLAFLLRRPSREPQNIDVTLDNATFPVRLRRNRQARRYTLRIQTATREVVLTMPQRGSIADARAFAQQHAAWIATRLHRLPDRIVFVPDAQVPLRGVPHRIMHRPDRRGVAFVEAGASGEPELHVPGQAPHVGRRVRDFLKKEAMHDLDAASRRYAGLLNVEISRISLRDQSSRWGSCSSTGRLCYSWRLIMAPPFVLDYLAAHEVAHLVELNHSPRFWAAVRGVCPDADRAKTWLDTQGAQLHRYDAPEP